MLIVGYCMGIRSERRLCEEVHLNLAYRWFCRLGLDGRVPDLKPISGPLERQRVWNEAPRLEDGAGQPASLVPSCGRASRVRGESTRASHNYRARAWWRQASQMGSWRIEERKSVGAIVTGKRRESAEDWPRKACVAAGSGRYRWRVVAGRVLGGFAQSATHAGRALVKRSREASLAARSCSRVLREGTGGRRAREVAGHLKPSIHSVRACEPRPSAASIAAWNPRNAWSLDTTPLVRGARRGRRASRPRRGRSRRCRRRCARAVGPGQLFVPALHLAILPCCAQRRVGGKRNGEANPAQVERWATNYRVLRATSQFPRPGRCAGAFGDVSSGVHLSAWLTTRTRRNIFAVGRDGNT